MLQRTWMTCPAVHGTAGSGKPLRSARTPAKNKPVSDQHQQCSRCCWRRFARNKGAYLVVGVGWLLGYITMLDERVQHTIPRHLELVRVTFQRVHTQQDRCCSSGQSRDPHNTAGEVNTPGNRDMRTPVRGHSPAGLYFSSRNSAWRLYIGDRKSVSSSQI